MDRKLLYTPITATPFQNKNSYKEIRPVNVLRPYIRCFWGSKNPYIQEKSTGTIVIPDTCVDIIYHIDYTCNKITGGFCGINDRCFYAHENHEEGHVVSTFAIRMYAFGAYKFANDSMRATINGYFDVEQKFDWITKKLQDAFFEMPTLEQKIQYVEKLFIDRLETRKNNEILDHAIYAMLENNGTLEMNDLAKEIFISTRQMERIFYEYIGITPKKLSNLFRYQLLWKDIISNFNLDIFHMIYKYGYTDQSHLLHEFKRYHSMDISSAKKLAFYDVGNLQDRV